MIITRPEAAEYAPYYENYIGKVTGNDLLAALKDGKARTYVFIKGIPEDKADFRYAPGKWTVKEVLLHLIDCERVFSYRALSFGRNDKTPLPGFEEDLWAPESNAANRTLSSILAEYDTVRRATIGLFEGFSAEAVLRVGLANNSPMSVRALGYAICGHELHHKEVITEKYLWTETN